MTLAMITRRRFLHSLLAASAWLGLGRRLYPAKADVSRVDALVKEYVAAYDVPGLSLAYGKGERIVIARGYGLTNRRDHQQVTTESLFRIASLSKPFASAAVFTGRSR
jgi:CubicO group peptidase (beta-lactamase class C family)